MSPGFKFNDWEMRGVPLRMELGPKDVAKNSVVLARRDRPGKEGKSFVPQQGIAVPSQQMLVEIQKVAVRPRVGFPRSQHRRPARISRNSRRRSKRDSPLLVVRRRGCEEKIKEETKATMRCIPLEQPGGSGKCIYCGSRSHRKGHLRQGLLAPPAAFTGRESTRICRVTA